MEQEFRVKTTRTNNSSYFPHTIQLHADYCAPASAEAVLRYFGLPQLRPFNSAFYSGLQETLAFLMQTKPTNGGTNPYNFLSILNYFIRENNLNQNREYSMLEIDREFAVVSVVNLIQRSLEHNVPVVLAFTGRHPNIARNYHISDEECHFVVIFVMTGNFNNDFSQSTLQFHYLETSTGQLSTFDAFFLQWLVIDHHERSSYIVSYDPNASEESQISHASSHRRKRQSEDMDNLYCPSETKIWYNSDKDRFIVQFILPPGSDVVELVVSLQTANAITKVFLTQEEVNFKKYLNALFRQIPKTTPLLGSISDSDYQVMADYIFDHYACFNVRILDILKEANRNTYSTITVSTNRKSWFDNCYANFYMAT